MEIHDEREKNSSVIVDYEKILCIVSMLKAMISTASKDLKDFFLESSSKQEVPFTVNFNHHYVQKMKIPEAKNRKKVFSR